MNVLAIDVGGTHVKCLVSGEQTPRRFDSGPKMTPEAMIRGVDELVQDWSYDVISIGFPAPVSRGKVMHEPANLGDGWVGFDFQAAFGCPVRIINDAAMQALGSYNGGRMLFLGLGTGLGSALIADGVVIPLELAHLGYKKGTYEDYLGERGLQRLGKRRWRKHVESVAQAFHHVLQLEDIVIGGGNVRHLDGLPPFCRAGNNALAFVGGFRMWDDATASAART
jgi:predicted NBD/HSP70 family sugar kinase